MPGGREPGAAGAADVVDEPARAGAKRRGVVLAADDEGRRADLRHQGREIRSRERLAGQRIALARAALERLSRIAHGRRIAGNERVVEPEAEQRADERGDTLRARRSRALP